MPENSSPDTLLRLRQVWVAAFSLLVVLTWRLWLPQFLTGPDSPWEVQFPAIPMISLPRAILGGLEGTGLALIVASCAWLLLRRQTGPTATLLLACGLTALFLANQHRLQPWAYQAWLYAWIFSAWHTSLTSRVALTWLTASVYFYSALGKFDQQFLQTVGPDFIHFLSPKSALAPEAATVAGINRIVFLLPTVELLIAISLLVPYSRRLAGWAATSMHLTLFVLLGPLFMDQSYAVLVWNLFLAVQAAWLFAFAPPTTTHSAEAEPLSRNQATTNTSGPPQPVRRILRPLFSVLIPLAVLMPSLERIPHGRPYGYWDHWLSWSLYSPHTSRTDIQIHQSATTDLPSFARQFAEPTPEDDGWLRVAIDRWSLAELSAPVYPQARFQLGVAEQLGQLVPPSAIRAKVRTTSDRWTGAREETWLLGQPAIEAQARQFPLIGRLPDPNP